METASAVLGALICTNKHISLSSGCGGSHVHATAASHRDALTRSPQIRKLSCISHSHSHRTMVVCLPCGPDASSDPHGACRAITRGRAPTCCWPAQRWSGGWLAHADCRTAVRGGFRSHVDPLPCWPGPRPFAFARAGSKGLELPSGGAAGSSPRHR